MNDCSHVLATWLFLPSLLLVTSIQTMHDEKAFVPVEEQVRNGFFATGLPRPLLSNVVHYCPDEKIITRLIRLPPRQTTRSTEYKATRYPTHAAISTRFETESTLRVLTTNNEFLDYDCASGDLLSRRPAHVRNTHLRPLNCVFVADELVNDGASSPLYEAKIIGSVGDVHNKKSRLTALKVNKKRKVPGKNWYGLVDNTQKSNEQPRTTIAIVEKRGHRSFAHLLGIRPNERNFPSDEKEEADE